MLAMFIFSASVGFICFLLATAFIMRWYYANKLKPTDEFPNGQMYAEIWTERGTRELLLVKIAVNGHEIEAPKGMKHPRYFFNKASVSHTAFPAEWPISFIQCPIDIVSWEENNPESIDPHRREALITAERLDDLRDDDALDFIRRVDEAYAKMQERWEKALMNAANKNVLYIMLAICALGSIGAAVIGILVLQAVKKLGGG
jgi:hypothetical protein